MISVLFNAWRNKIRKWCFHLGTCAHCMLLMLASVYCRIKNSLSKHHHQYTVWHKLDKFHAHFLHQRLIALETVPYVDGLMEYRSKWNLRSFCWKYLTGVNYWDEVVVSLLGLIYVALHQVNCGIRKCSTTFSLSQWSHSLV